MIPELFAVHKATKVEIKKENQVLMVKKTTGFKKSKGKEGKLHEWQARCRPREETKG